MTKGTRIPIAQISSAALQCRSEFVHWLPTLEGSFTENFATIEVRLEKEIAANGSDALIDHLRLCGSIPERYGASSSEEKLYSKYTDLAVALALTQLGMTSNVLAERADAADVDTVCSDFSLVGDAKTFRLSRTARNAKDFKVSSMHGWKLKKDYALLVCPLYKLPDRESQIYRQAVERDVCILSFEHMALLLSFGRETSADAGKQLLWELLKLIGSLYPTKNAQDYWRAVNMLMLEFHPSIRALWTAEKVAASEALTYAKKEALEYYAEERRRLMGLDHKQALKELLKARKFDLIEKRIAAIRDNGLLGVV